MDGRKWDISPAEEDILGPGRTAGHCPRPHSYKSCPGKHSRLGGSLKSGVRAARARGWGFNPAHRSPKPRRQGCPLPRTAGKVRSDTPRERTGPRPRGAGPVGAAVLPSKAYFRRGRGSPPRLPECAGREKELGVRGRGGTLARPPPPNAPGPTADQRSELASPSCGRAPTYRAIALLLRRSLRAFSRGRRPEGARGERSFPGGTSREKGARRLLTYFSAPRSARPPPRS
ncbi:uncharacterized protein [Notamacropus eugenii]|uniref:uncharacterized protein n=1 Tax=Notamacropus eugenii TaxID=9315 RepID=UPI003B66B885